MARNGVNSQAKEAAKARRLAAVEYRKLRVSYRDIAKRLDVSHETARRDVKAALKEIDKYTDESAEELVLLEREWLDFCRQGLVPKIAKGDVGAAKEGRQNSESLRGLLGLDAPMKFAATTPDGKDEAGSALASALEKIAARIAAAPDERGAESAAGEPEQ